MYSVTSSPVTMRLAIRVLAGVLFVVGTGFIIWANVIFYSVLDEVNARSAPQDKYSFLFVKTKYEQILQKHQALLPDSSKRKTLKAAAYGGFVLGGLAFLLLILSSHF